MSGATNNPGQQQLYQRAVTPTVQTLNIPQHQHLQPQQINTDRDYNPSVKGKVLSYGTNQQMSANQGSNMSINASGISRGFVQQPSSAVNIALTVKSPRSMAAAAAAAAVAANSGSGQSATLTSRTNIRQSQPSSAAATNSLETASMVSSSLPLSPNPQQLAPAPDLASTYMPPRYDLVPFVQGVGIEPAAAISEGISVPADGIIFARIRGHPESLVVFRTPEERLRNPERLNLDRRQLEICPILEQEQRLRLLNFQNNNIRLIQNLENLPNLIFLDLYNNKITTLEGSVSSVKGLRVLMAGKNKIGALSNLGQLRKLDVLDLHSNEIKVIEGLENLADLRVLNLAGNRITSVSSLSSLASLTELNLRRNFIERVSGIERLPMLQRVFLSHNLISALGDVDCLFQVRFLIELSLDGNPVSNKDAIAYRNAVILGIPGLRHLDLKRIAEDERVAAAAAISSRRDGSQFQTYNYDAMAAKASGSTLTRRPDSAIEDLHGRGFDPVESLGREIAGLGLGDFKSTEEVNVADIYAISSSTNKAINLVRHEGNGSGHRPSDAPAKGSEVGIGAGTREGKEASGGETSKYGKLSANDVFLGFEVSSAQEKAMVVSGEVSMADWMQARRQMSSVAELSLLHMSHSVIISKLTAVNLSAGAQSIENILFPAVKTLRFMFNDFHSIRNVDFIPEWFSSTVEHVVIRDNPICVASSSLVRNYLIASMPLLRLYNDEAVSPAERFAAERQFRPLLDSLAATRAQATQLLSKASFLQRTSSNSLPQQQQLHLQLQLLIGQQQPRPKAAAAASSHPPVIEGRNKVAVAQPSDGNNFSDVFEKVVTKIILDTLNTIRPSTS